MVGVDGRVCDTNMDVEAVGVKLGFSYSGMNTCKGCPRIGCWGAYYNITSVVLFEQTLKQHKSETCPYSSRRTGVK
jgi:hypothetical protein